MRSECAVSRHGLCCRESELVHSRVLVRSGGMKPLTAPRWRTFFVLLVLVDACGGRSSDDPAVEHHQAALAVGGVLLVVGNASLSPADDAIKARLEELGFTVSIKEDTAATTADATGKTLVYISSTVNSADVNTKYRTVTVPVLCSERLLFDEQGMTGNTFWDQGTITQQTSAVSQDSSHPLSAGLDPPGEPVAVVHAPGVFGWGVPNDNAAKIISLADDPTRFLSFGYEVGAAMPGLTAPARRAGFFLADTTANILTPQGWSLFDAAVRWAAGLVPVVSITQGDGDASEEGPDDGTVIVSRTGDTALPLNVVFGVGGTAANGVDYTSLTPHPDTARVVTTIPAGQTSTTVNVEVIDDSEGEGFELASFTLRKDWRYSVSVTQRRATVTLSDDNDLPPARGSLLFVVGNTTLNAGDTAVKGHLVSQGYTVTVKPAVSAGIGDAIGKDAVLISSTVNSGDLRDTFRDSPVPVMIWESSLWDDMGMVPATSGSYGTTSGQTQLSILRPDQPPAAALEGQVVATSPSDTFRWGRPHPENALILASLPGDPSKATIFGYDPGVTVSGGFWATSRRLGFFLADNTATKLTPYGWMLFDAAVKWTIGKLHQESIAPFLATPAADHLWEVPVAIVRYLPTNDGVHLPGESFEMEETLQSIRDRVDVADKQVKFTLEEGSRFRGYKTPAAKPSLGYRVVKIVTIYEPMPASNWPAGTDFIPDYHSMLERIGGRELVEITGVKEFWVWGHPAGGISQPESNMSSPITGDISNSWREEDLPVYNRSYVVYGYNYLFGEENAIHNHGHQLEAILSHINWTRDLDISNRELFWQKFAGRNELGQAIAGRCGWTHSPPNTTVEYLYDSPDVVESDIEDWTPSGTGQKTMVSVSTWRDQSYAWPDGEVPSDRASANFYLYWMQAMPGRDNGIRHPEADSPELGQATLNNWWSFTGDWDAYATNGPGLVKHTP